MGKIIFSTVFSGGVGELDIISHDTGVTLEFTEKTANPQSITLPIGSHIFSVMGAAPAGAGGNIALAITGDIPAEVDQNFLSGNIPPHPLILFVTK